GVVQASFTVSAIIPAVSVSDQTPSPATEVVVDSATSPGPGWVVIYADAGGMQGMRLGQAALSNNANTNVTVTLSRATNPGETLHAAIHVDRGMQGTYEDAVDVAA